MKKILLCLLIACSYPALCQNVALNFDGTNDYVQTTFSGVSDSAARTVEAWIKTTAITAGSQKVICDWGNMLTGSRFTFNMLQNNSIRIEVGGSGLVGTTAVNNGQWHHVAVVYDPAATNRFSLYIDGVLETSGNLPTAVNTLPTNTMVIGRRIDGINYFNGSIDEVRVYNVALSAAQILASKDQELCAAPSGLVAYYKLNEGTAGANNAGHTVATDYSGNNHNGTLNAFALTGTGSNWVAGPTLTGGNTAGSLTASNCASYISPSGHHVWTMGGTYTDTIANAAGCDSVITVHLSIGASRDTIYPHACDTFVAPNGAHLTQSGTYIDSFTSAGGCDSIIIIHLTVGTGRYSITVNTCDSFKTLAGKTYMQSGTYTDTIFNHNASGCDSIITTYLTIYHSSHTTANLAACDSILINGSWYRSSQTLNVHFTNSRGCDSLVSITLTVTSIHRTVTQTGATLTAQQSGAAYAWLDCNSHTLINGATAATYTSTVNGNFACIITMGGCSDTSACYAITGLGLNETDAFTNTHVTPNPNTGSFSLHFDGTVFASSYRIVDLPGRTLVAKALNAEKSFEIRESLAPGSYFILVNTNRGLFCQKFVVE